MMSRGFLWIVAAVFVAFGLWGLLRPLAMVKNFGVTLGGPDAVTMIRASYGGFLIGEGLLFAWSAQSPDRVRFGLTAVVLMTLPILISRLIGIVVDGARSPYHMAYLAIEFAGIGLAVLLLRKAPRP